MSTRAIHQAFAALLTASIITGVASVGAFAAGDRSAKPVNVARTATATATSEHSANYRAARVVDGNIPAPTSRNDGGAAWAVNGDTHRNGTEITLTWDEPVVVAELVYYGRCSGDWRENWKDYEVHVDGAKAPTAKGTLSLGRGPQRMALPRPVTARSIRLKFLSSYGGLNPGASEIQAWSASPSAKTLGPFVAKNPGASRAKKKPPTPTPPKASPQLRSKLLAGPLADIEEIVFAARGLGSDGHWYANFSYYAADENRKAYGMGGKLARVNLRTGKVTVLIDDPKGTLRDPVVDYDGRRIVFCWRKAGTDHFNMYEIHADGKGLRQLTDGPWDDIEPAFLPDGDIIFVSSRAKRWVNCWLTQVAVLHRCDRDGRNIRQISANLEHDNTPWPLPDGRILYTRWEYVDRNQVTYHHLWTANPDGTNQTVYFGNMHPGTTMIDAKPIPGSDKVVVSFSPRHGRKEHAGPVTIVDPNAGPDAQAFARTITPKREYRDPWAISENCFLAADGPSIIGIDGSGATVPLYTLSSEDRARKLHLHEPRPLIPRRREQVIPPRTDPSKATGMLVLADVYQGRNMVGVKRGDIKKLLVIESLPKPINFTGGMEPLSYGGTFSLERVVGTVPVEDDGSAFMELPALRSLFFVALDENDMAVKRMQSFLTVMPGETTSCVGCHENRVDTPRYAAGRNLMATRRSPSRIEPITDVPDVLDFLRDVQPILDKHCLKCHDVDKREGGVILSGDPGPMFPLSYFTLTVRNQFADGRNGPANRAPRTIGSSASPLMQKLLPSHNKVQTTERERKILRLWIETGAAFPGTYAALGSGMVGGYAQNRIDRSDLKWPSTPPAMKALQKRCGSCHKGKNMSLPMTVSDNRPNPPWKTLTPDDPRRKYSRHLLYNLGRPDKSLILLAPLARSAGGYGMTVKGAGGKPDKCIEIFADTSDKDYQAILAHVRDAKKKLDEIKRFHMPGFIPPWGYVREMKRYGILPASHKKDDPVDVYAADRAYWKSLWYVPKSD